MVGIWLLITDRTFFFSNRRLAVANISKDVAIATNFRVKIGSIHCLGIPKRIGIWQFRF